jgi:ribulose-5-phosphate 4-epimerase/fuculose-1-phosphate aldolase
MITETVTLPMLSDSPSAALGLRMPPVGHVLDLRQRLACLFRLLARDGWSENFQGHITCEDGSGNLLVNPWGLWWDEIRTSDVCTVDLDGRVLNGQRDVSPAIYIHTELHRIRPDARVIVHNHPYYGTLLASMGVLPEINTQSSCLFQDALGVFDDFTGPVVDVDLGRQLAERLGSASACLLTSHGVLITAPTIEAAALRAVSFERACKMTYDMLVAGRSPLPIDPDLARTTQSRLDTIGVEAFWGGAVRLLLRAEPDVLL